MQIHGINRIFLSIIHCENDKLLYITPYTIRWHYSSVLRIQKQISLKNRLKKRHLSNFIISYYKLEYNSILTKTLIYFQVKIIL